MTHPGIPPVAPDGITERANELLATSYADNTITSYTSKMTLFVTFLSRHQSMMTQWNGSAPTMPAVAPTTLMFFCGFMLMRGFKSAGSIAGYCTAVRQWCLINDRPDPTVNPATNTVDTRYARLHRAIKRKLGSKATEREPLSIKGLKLLLAAIRSGFVVPACTIPDFIAAILLGFYGMLRISEFTNKTTSHHDPTREACRADVQFFGPTDEPTGFRYTIKVAKNSQFRVQQTITVFRSPNPQLCPVRAMQRLFATDDRAPAKPLFDFTVRHSNQSTRHVSGARSRFIKVFQHAIRRVGLSTKKIQSHSLRAGGATAYLNAGIDPYIIQRMGRWRSWCWMIYTWTSTNHIQHAMESVAHCDETSTPTNAEGVRVTLDSIKW